MSLQKGSMFALGGAAVVAIAAVLLAAASFGREGSGERLRSGVAVHPPAGTPAASVSAKSRKTGLTVRYLETGKETVGPAGTTGFSFTCPKKAPRAIGGYAGPGDQASQGQIVISDSSPFKNGRAWSIGVRNLSDQPRTFYVGAVCAK
jgi:hypothetical protein